MLGTTVYVHEVYGWRPFRGPKFITRRRAEKWALELVEELAQGGRESAVAVWDWLTREVVFETRCRRVADAPGVN